MRYIFIPPGGFQGFAEQTIAVKALLGTTARRTKAKSPARTRVTRARPKRRAPVKRATHRRSGPKLSQGTRRKTARPARMVKGSAAAKRHMSKLRKMRRR